MICFAVVVVVGLCRKIVDEAKVSGKHFGARLRLSIYKERNTKWVNHNRKIEYAWFLKKKNMNYFLHLKKQEK